MPREGIQSFPLIDDMAICNLRLDGLLLHLDGVGLFCAKRGGLGRRDNPLFCAKYG